MPPLFIGLVFTILAAAGVYGIARSILTGIAGHAPWNFDKKENPVGFSLALIGKALAVALCATIVVHSAGFIGDPLQLVGAYMPFHGHR